MDIKKIKKLGETWKVLNEKYDGCIQEIIDAPEEVASTLERLKELKSLQKELHELEVELLGSWQSK